jgi:hypothetical protein
LNAVLQAEFQHPKEAIQSLEKAAAVGNTWRNDLLIHGASKRSTQLRVCWSLNRVLNRTAIEDTDLISISGLLTSSSLGMTKEVMLNERCFGLSQASQIQSLARQTRGYTLSPARILIRLYQSRIIYRDQDLLNLLDRYERSLAATDLPLSNAIPVLTELEKRRDNLTKSEHSLLNKYLLNTLKKDRFSFLVPLELACRQILLPEADAIAQIRATRTSLAVERWRLTHDGNVPHSLADLVPGFLVAIPTDPFDEQPLRYKKLARGFVVYSIGPDFTDDGGKEKPADAKEADHYDITFTVER